MESTPKKKLCWNCDGQVALQEELCPFCGVYLSPSLDAGAPESVQTLAPPYRIVTTQEENNKFIPQSPFNLDQPQESTQEPFTAIELSPVIGLKEMLFTMILLFTGSLFFLFSIFMFLFGYNGTFSLSWNADYWYVYLIIALPLFVFGWRGLSLLKETD